MRCSLNIPGHPIIALKKDINSNPQAYTTQENIEQIRNNPQVYTTQESIEQIKTNPQVYTIQEGMQEIKKKPSGIHYPRGYRRD